MDEGTARLTVADLIGCRAVAGMTTAAAVEAFVSTLTDAAATIVQVVSHHYPGQGLTCVAILKESHAVLHTWPETGIVHVDIFTCSGSLRTGEAIAALGRIFAADRVDTRDVARASDPARPRHFV